MHPFRTRPGWFAVISLVLLASFAQAQSKNRQFFGKGKPFTIDELPSGKLKEQLQALEPTARGKAMNWLHGMSFQALDAASHLRADRDGGIFFTCPGNQHQCADGCPHGAGHQVDELSKKSGTEPSIEAVGDASGEQPAQPLAEGAAVPVANPPAYNSKPGSAHHIYLDFNGAFVSGKAWQQLKSDGGTPTDPSDDTYYTEWDCKAWSTDSDYTTFSDSEQAAIRRIWERVAEDYAPFDVNVTTEVTYDPDNYTGDKNSVGWLLITERTDKNGNPCPHTGSGGVAYVGVFSRSDYHSRYQPAWVTPMGEANTAEAASHEMGHNLGLSHDGYSGNVYYGGHASSSTAPSWGPIMGTGYNRNVSQWSMGEYWDSKYWEWNPSTGQYDILANTQNDLAEITTHIAYRDDDHGGDSNSATVLPSSTVNSSGIIERTNDLDYFRFVAGTGPLVFDASAYQCATGTWGSNLDIQLELYDKDLSLVASANPDTDVDATLNYTVSTGGEFFLVVKPSGAGLPMNNPPSGYAVYGSLGQYSLTGSFTPSDSIVVFAPNGGEVLNTGQTKEITWGSGIAGNVKIELYKGGIKYDDGGLGDIAMNETNDGSFVWSVPANLPVADDYKIRVTSLNDSSKWDESNTSFTVSSLPTIASAVDNQVLSWTTGGNAGWFPQTTTTQDGVDAAQSGALTDDQSSWVETTVNGPGNLSFWWKVSSEAGWDKLFFYVNGAQQLVIDGDVDWKQESISLPSGSHTLRWSYVKDGTVSDPVDAGWLDQVVYISATAPDITVEQPTNTALIDGSSTIDFGTSSSGVSASPLSFTIRNDGNEDLTGLALSVTGAHSGDYALGALGANTLAPGASTTFNVTFTPGDIGTRTAAIEVTSNDPDENPFDILLTGTGSGPAAMTVSAAGGLSADGLEGGPFSPSSIQYTLENTGGSSLEWSAISNESWVSLSNTSGTLAVGATTTVTVSINSNANSLGVGSYSDTVSFTNTINGAGDTSRSVSLTVNGLNLLWAENFDASSNTPSGWSVNASAGTSSWSVSTNPTFARSASNCYLAPAPTSKLTAHIETGPIAIPATSTLCQVRFWHNFNLEDGRDGGRIQLSIDGGAWYDIEDVGSGASFVSNPYTTTISSSGKPDGRSDFDGMNAWSGDSGGYIQTIVSLSDAAKYSGHVLRVRWTIATDSTTASTYWFLDDVSVVTDATLVDAFDLWSGGSEFGADDNGDGVPDGLAWALGADDKSPNATALLPVIDNESDATYFIFNYRRADVANNDPRTSFSVEYNTTLDAWIPVSHDGNNVIITPYDDSYASGVDRVEVKLKRSSFEANGRMFGRLKVSRTP